MKYFGGLVFLAYAAMTLMGWEPFTREERGEVPAGVRRTPSGLMGWTSGFHGGK